VICLFTITRHLIDKGGTMPHHFNAYIIAGILAILACCQLSPAQPAAYQVDGTTGAPLGGIGCGAIKFKASDGTFTATFTTPTAMENFFTNNNNMGSTCFQFYSKRGTTVQTSDKLTAVVAGGRADDDAVYPAHFANLGTINGISLVLTAFSPFDLANVPLMCFPYAFYQVKMTNTGATAAEASVAFQTQPASTPVLVSGKGLRTASGVQRAIYATSDNSSAVISVGGDAGFKTTGVCNNTISGALNRVAVKVSLAAGQSSLVKFVFAWHNGNDPTRFFYTNAFANAGAVADTGLAHFDAFRDNAVNFITRMRASNLPSWIKNQALVTLCNLTNNSIYTKDGRYAHTEGMWNTNGTMDQMWHARQIYAMTVPSLVWQEMRYWARTQKTNPAGQIHHDLGEHYNVAYLCPWDDQQHTDYRDIDRWVDLNCAFITSVYEVFIATDDHTQLDWFWPYVKKAGQRILDMTQSFGMPGYPYTFQGTQNSYDAGGEPDPYNASLSITTYKMMSALAEIKGETALKQTYDQAFTTASDSFKKRYLTNNFPTGRISESIMAGQWLGYYLHLGEFFPQASVDYAIGALDGYYHPATSGLGYAGGTYDEWAPYLISHYAGLLLLTNRTADWRAMQQDWYERNFLDRNLVYNQQLGIPRKVGTPSYLAGTTQGSDQYISVPVVWRNYYALTGYFRNKHTGELRLEPIIPAEMNHQMTDACIASPEGFAKIGCAESGTNYQNQTITFVPDAATAVTSLYLKDKGCTSANATVNGASIPVQRVGAGYAKELKIDINQTIPKSGIQITMTGAQIDIVMTGTEIRRHHKASQGLAPLIFDGARGMVTINAPGSFEIKLIDSAGKTIAHRRMQGIGAYTLAESTTLRPGMYVAKVTGDKGSWRNAVPVLGKERTR